MKIHHAVSSSETSQDIVVDFYVETTMGPLYLKPLYISSAFMSPAQREAKIAETISRYATRLRALMETGYEC